MNLNLLLLLLMLPEVRIKSGTYLTPLCVQQT